MTTILKLRPIVQTVEAWRYQGQPEHEWPDWVKGYAPLWRDFMVHERQSGKQAVYLGEWLVRFPNGEVYWFTNDEMASMFLGEDPAER